MKKLTVIFQKISVKKSVRYTEGWGKERKLFSLVLIPLSHNMSDIILSSQRWLVCMYSEVKYVRGIWLNVDFVELHVQNWQATMNCICWRWLRANVLRGMCMLLRIMLCQRFHSFSKLKCFTQSWFRLLFRLILFSIWCPLQGRF